MKNYIEYIIFKFFVFLTNLLPFKVSQRLGKAFGIFAYYFIPYRKKVALENLRKAFPEKDEKVLKQILKMTYVNLAITFFEFMSFPKLKADDLKKIARFENLNYVYEGLSKGRGLILMSGHFGNWELNAVVTSLEIGKPLSIIVKTQRNRLVDKEINKWRCWFGNKVIPMERAFRESLKILSEGGIIALLADQSAPKEGLYVNFLGRPASTFAGPALMSLRTGAPIVMGFAVRDKNYNYRIIFEKVDFTPSGNESEDIFNLTQIHTSLLEKYVHLYPDHWLWFHRRWKHTPTHNLSPKR
ncbi:KDO2-lipid IV(A) lauroyltransferase [Candidatus Kryptonium thompsonii]|uniref:KDO2-lipid IV(A) lauroyltransferase n=1 Tax=Candidatus Kryptonium thompsonii TaxID=1633631 RepID=A0A0P1LMQ6_9BACT|nr:lysophospholipid acyltransferase family protein [Candidatus Kryptonium thompsoni]CUS76460.1 KDO2-lipid IV(A) lauroyltransferase [Candidatus Kryptonium thompsoni]CUS76686.1 KDO2-lipid IV(A) lauroyltransferase [Candidatus Kryptonium thompsoni]CUS83183.1 KDO2-lipid IV(A) lauroyltransferase [Candidatus Kryptonium thompsoni]CUS83202.1 KDO2-lipid IV(A) lauroyltransferase [Candidatus Kryptonium thompsoni]CUS84718.1 KDO2-lipid IV(A) lauroyltransferase [Candidatus Kryptonium thompsoni]